MRNLSEELTVFIITTSGDVNYKDCIQALKYQTVRFKVEVIKDYFPLSKAFQEMLNRCKTKYYIEVDNDMILNPDAIEKMYDTMKSNDDCHPFTCFQLLDVHLDFKLYGVKIYDYEVFKKYPYNLDHPSCEVEQMKRMRLDGYVFDDEQALREEVVGKHSPNWTEEGIFERYYNLMEKFKLYKYVWLERLPKKLFNAFRKNPTIVNFYAIAGALSSIYSDNKMEEEKDVRKKRIDFKRVDGFMERPHQATIYLTSKCNFKCIWCARQLGNFEGGAPDADVKVTSALIGKFPSIKGVCICGFGETLLSDNLVPVLQTLKSANKVVGLITNGALLTQKLSGLVGWYQPDYISVSLNSHCAELHEKTTGTKTWETVLDGIRALVSSPIPAYVSSVVTTENLIFVPELIKLVHSLGVKTLHLHNLLPHHKEGDDKDFWRLVLQKDTHWKFIEEVKKMPEASIVKTYPTLIDKSGGKQVCNFAWRMVGIDGNGDLSICNSVFPCNKEKFGNIWDFVVWNSDKCRKFRDDFVNKKIDACSKCFRNWTWM